MLLCTSLLCIFFVNLVASQSFPPEVFAGYDPRTILQPLSNRMESNNVRLIRTLLAVKRAECPTGYVECANRPERLVLQFVLLSTSSYSTPVLVVAVFQQFHDDECV